MSILEKRERLARSNELIRMSSSKGTLFWDRLVQLDLDAQGVVYVQEGSSGSKSYITTCPDFLGLNEWDVILALRDFIDDGTTVEYLNAYLLPEDGEWWDEWGYGEEPTKAVHKFATDLGIITQEVAND